MVNLNLIPKCDKNTNKECKICMQLNNQENHLYRETELLNIHNDVCNLNILT